MRALGIDYGDVRIGVALSDPLGLTAQAYEVIDRRRVHDVIAHICDIAVKEAAERIVVGLPRNMNGTYGERAEKSRSFAEQLISASGLPVDLVDERLSTVTAQRMLISGNVRRDKRRQVIDKVAAAVILQSWLDRKGRT